MRRAVSASVLFALLLLGWQQASGYGHFVRYLNGSGSYRAAVTRFDLRVLPGNLVPYYIQARGPERLAEGDSREALFSQIQSAAEVWNSVKTSGLRLAFGGLLETEAAPQGPRVEIIFDEIPPGLVAMAGPEVLGELSEEDGKEFVPIVKSLLVLPANLAEPARPSWSERLYQTIVHEMGHTLGLQHSWASSTMSTEITRATTKGLPLAADDAAGISALYPTKAFRERTAAITGRVLRAGSGAPVALASVVAFSPTGDAVSALTGPDGAYRIEGLVPGAYYLYAHPLPPSIAGEPEPVNLDLPIGPEGRILPGAPFNVTFFPGTTTPEFPVDVVEGTVHEGLDFQVSWRDRVTLHSVQTYRFFGQQAVKPAFFHAGESLAAMVLYGYGMSTQSGPVAGLIASPLRVPETFLPPGLFAYAPAPSYLQMNFSVPEGAPQGPRHVLFRLGGESHVAPAAYRVAKAIPPVLMAVTGNPDGTVTLSGANLSGVTAVRFDGAPAKVLEHEDSSLRVQPPSAPARHRARVSVFDADGQSSAMVDGGTAHVYEYPDRPAPVVTVRKATLAPGVEAVLELTGTETDWNGGLKAGFGSADVVVRRLWVVSPGRALAHVHVSPSAQAVSLALTVADGMTLTTVPEAVALHPAGVQQLYIVTSSMAEVSTAPGAELLVPVGNLLSPLFVAGTEVRIGGEPATVLSVNGSTALVRVPESLSPGPALVEMKVLGQEVLPGVVVIVPAPPAINSVQTLAGTAVSGSKAPSPGELIRILVTGLPPGMTGPDGLAAVSESLVHSVTAIEPAGDGYVLTIRLSERTPRGAVVPLVISYRDVASSPVPIPIL